MGGQNEEDAENEEKRSEEVKHQTKEGEVLSAVQVARSVSQLGRLSSGTQYLYQNLFLPNKNLSDISILSRFVHLQRLELPHNKIKDLTCVSHMPSLVILDASHNEISAFFGFQPPKNLKEVNFSNNRMSKMKNLSAFSSLSNLQLDHNSFSEISGLEQCALLYQLSLAHNRISRISGLDNLPLSHLCLRGNRLEKIEGLENLRSLQSLDLSLNRIRSLAGLQNLSLLGSLNLEKNLISEIQECKHIHDLCLLRDMNLLQNPVQEQKDYRLSVIFLLQHLTTLDQQEVTAEEKVSSVNKYDPPMDVVAATNHMTHLVYQLMQPQVLYDSTFPSADCPYPMLVLTGPQGCGKRELAHRLCQDLHEYFGYGICHTTRGPYFGEENGIDYHFVSEEDFENMVLMGKFIQTMQYGGHRFGLTRDAVEEVAKEGLACCLHMELEGVLSLKNSYFEPRYILIIPTSVEKYISNLNDRDLYTQAQIDRAVSRIQLYANTCRQRPGFFDNVIPSDDWKESYPALKKVVTGYLFAEERDDQTSSTFSGLKHLSLSAGQTGTSLDPSDPAYRNYLAKIQAELSLQKNPNELASIRRREQLVREAVLGKSPGVFSQPAKRPNISVQPSAPLQSLITSGQSHPDSPPQAEEIPPQTADPRIPVSQKSSGVEEHRACSAVTAATSARGIVKALDIAAMGSALDTLKEKLENSKSPGAADAEREQKPETGQEQRAPVTSPSSRRRPGSETKPILPPIPTGRKTPARPRSCPSRPSSTTAEEAEAEAEEVEVEVEVAEEEEEVEKDDEADVEEESAREET